MSETADKIAKSAKLHCEKILGFCSDCFRFVEFLNFFFFFFFFFFCSGHHWVLRAANLYSLAILLETVATGDPATLRCHFFFCSNSRISLNQPDTFAKFKVISTVI